MTDRLLRDQEIANRLGALPGWHYAEGAIRRSYETDGWRSTLMVVNAIGYACEAAFHHPDLAVSWGRVDVALHTHSAGGITAKDFETAALIDRAVLAGPGEGSALSGPPEPLIR